MVRSNEPIWWSLFSAGGVVAAFLIPVGILITGILLPAGWISPEELRGFFGHLLTRLVLLVLISLPLFHWAHRFRYVLADLGLKGIPVLLAVICYGAAILGTFLAAYHLLFS